MAFQYGQISQSQAVNAYIDRCFEELGESERMIFIRKFRQQPHDGPQVMHTLRELILGAYLHAAGFQVRCEQEVQGKTPDWVIVDDRQTPRAIVELVNFHIDHRTEVDIQNQIQSKSYAVFWQNENTDNLVRLYNSLERKAQVYRDLAAGLDLPYVIAVSGDAKAVLDLDDVRACLDGMCGRLFDEYPHVSGILFFDENSGQYCFQYLENAASPRKLAIESGSFSRERPMNRQKTTLLIEIEKAIAAMEPRSEAKNVKIKNMTDMAFIFSAMTRVFEKGSKKKIISQLECSFSRLAQVDSQVAFDQVHADFCQWFVENVSMAKKGQAASYGQAGKVFDVAGKVLVYYCHQPNCQSAEKLIPMLHAAVDTIMMKILIEKYPKMGVQAKTIGDVDRQKYSTLQKMVGQHIAEVFHGLIYPVQYDDIVWYLVNRA